MCLNTGTPKNINFSFETNGKLTALGVPILKHFRVSNTDVSKYISMSKNIERHVSYDPLHLNSWTRLFKALLA